MTRFLEVSRCVPHVRLWTIGSGLGTAIREQPVQFIEALVGHKRTGMSLGRYSGGPLMQQFRAVVEAVRLPEEEV
jgi:hypothetical protein